MDLAIEAQRLATLNLPIFRVNPGKKTPMRKGWQTEATTDAGTVADLWQECPSASIGIACGAACWALDIDGEPGRLTLQSLMDRHGPLPSTPTSQTGGGGWHLLFRGNSRVRNSVMRLGPGLDTRAAGGLIVAPPSPHQSGRRYEWADGRTPWEVPLADAPAWLLNLLDPPVVKHSPPERPMMRQLRSTRYVAAAVCSELERVCLAHEGRRNDALNRAAYALGRFVAAGELDAREVGPALVGAALATGLTRHEAERTVRSGLRAAVREVG